MSVFAALTTSDACTHAHTSEQTAAAAVQESVAGGSNPNSPDALFAAAALCACMHTSGLPQSRPSGIARLKVAMKGDTIARQRPDVQCGQVVYPSKVT